MVWDTSSQFKDDFDNSTVDFLTHPGNGTITEPAGTQLRIYCPENQFCSIYSYEELNYADLAVAYKPAGPPLLGQRINGPWLFELKFDDFNYTYNTTLAGLFIWKGDLTDGYSYEFGFYPYENKIIINRWLGYFSSSTRLHTSVSKSAPNGTTTHIYRVYINPCDRQLWIPEHSTYINANGIAFTYSTDSGATFTWGHERTLDFQIDWIGPYVRSWDPAAGRTYEGLFDYFSMQSYDWNVLKWLPDIPLSYNEPSGADAQTHAGVIEEVRFVPSGISDYQNQISRGHLIPGARISGQEDNYKPPTSSLEDEYIIFPEHTQFLTPGSKESYLSGGRPVVMGAEDDEEISITGFPATQQTMRGEDSGYCCFAEADYMESINDADGKAFLSGSDSTEALLIDTTQGSFGNPTSLNHWGAARDGKFYADGVECTPGVFGTIANGWNHVGWRNSEEELFAVSSAAGSMSIISDDVVRMTGTFTSWPGGPALFSNLKWVLEGDFDIQVDFDNLVEDDPNHELSLIALYEYGPTNQVFIGRRDDHYTFMRIVDGTWTSIATGGSADLSGKLRLTRSGTTIHGYYWGGSSWVEVGSGYAHYKGAAPVFVRVMINGTNGVNFTVDVSNFTINSGTVNNRVGWYRETAGTHRGSRSDIPELLAIINTSTSINLIDVTNNKLWMRFVRDQYNLLPYFSSYGQIPRGMAWNNGILFIAEGSMPSQSAEGCAILLDFRMDAAHIHRQSVSSICGSSYADGYVKSEGLIPLRNDGMNYFVDRDSWAIQNYRCYDVALFEDSGMLYRAVATTAGLAIFKWEYGTVVYGSFILYTAIKSYSSETDHFLRCIFDQSDGTIFYVSSSTLYSRNKTNGSTGWEDLMDGGSFTAEYNKTLPGTRTCDWQYRIIRYSSYIFIPAKEGVYRVNWPSGSWELYYGVGGTYDILPPYTQIISIQLDNDGTNDLLIIGIEQKESSLIAVVNLNSNTLYGITASQIQAKSPRMVAA